MTPSINDIISELDRRYPLRTQDSWDNSGLLVGDGSRLVTGVLTTLDFCEEVLDKAEAEACSLVVAHHPLMLKTPLKHLTGASREECLVIRALRSGIALAAFHTPLDKSADGLSHHLGELLGLRNLTTLCPEAGHWCKVVSYVPRSAAERIGTAMASAGAGKLGQYDSCSWRTTGEGRFRPLEGSHPFSGIAGELHHEEEVRIEALCPAASVDHVVLAIEAAHPYECPATDVLPLDNKDYQTGYGMIGELDQEMTSEDFLTLVATKLQLPVLRHTAPRGLIKSVAVCTGSAIEFAAQAKRLGADAYITADVKYHQMQDVAPDLLTLDIGHYESERYAADILLNAITRKFGNFVRSMAWVAPNPVRYHFATQP